MPTGFDRFFQSASGNLPYEYQRRLACGENGGRSEAEWLADGSDCKSLLISIPTGLGKTAAVILGWMWNRIMRNEQAWPCRMVYCLPMRTLVEQTRGAVSNWIDSVLKSAEAGGIGSHVASAADGPDGNGWEVARNANRN